MLTFNHEPYKAFQFIRAIIFDGAANEMISKARSNNANKKQIIQIYYFINKSFIGRSKFFVTQLWTN